MIRAFLKEYRAILILAFLLTLIIKAPVLFFPYVAQEAYQGIDIYHHANLAVDEDFYLSRGKEVLEGHSLGNPLMREGKETNPDYYFNVTELVLVGPFRLLGLADTINIATLYNFYNSVGLFILILVIYFFALELKTDKLFAATAAIFVVSGYSVLDHRAFFEPVFNMYGRSLTPYISSLAFFSYAFLCVRALKTPSLKRSVCVGIVFGVLSYIYSYAWTFTLLFNGFLFLVYTVQRDWQRVRHITLISAVGMLVAAYNIMRTVLFLSSPAGNQFLYFYGAEYARVLAYKKLGPLLLLLFGVFAYKNHTDKAWPILYALLGAGWFAINQQIITGVSIQSDHYLWYYTLPVFIVAFFYVFWSLVTDQRARRVISTILITIFFINTTMEQRNAFLKTLDERLQEQNYRPALDILRAAKDPGVVLAADDDPELLITVYTPHDLFWQWSLARFNDNPLARHRDALLVYLYLNKDARADPAAFLNRLLREKENPSFYQQIYQGIEGFYSGFGLDDYYIRLDQNDPALLQKRRQLIDSLVKEYTALIKDHDVVEKLLTRYDVGWVLWDKNRQPEWDLRVLRGLKAVSSHRGIFLFERVQ